MLMIQERRVAPQGSYKQFLPLNMWQECQSYMELLFWLVKLAYIFALVFNQVSVHPIIRGVLFRHVSVSSCCTKCALVHTTQKHT